MSNVRGAGHPRTADVVLPVIEWTYPLRGTIICISRALTAGRRTALLTVVGNEWGLLVQSAAVAFGVGEVVQRSAQLFTVINDRHRDIPGGYRPQGLTGLVVLIP
jgi:hypothetical protein